MHENAAIETIALRKSYGGTPVLTGVDLLVPHGAVYALLGPNGAGKTTTIRILATLLRPDGGRARVAGHDVVAERHRVRRAISLTGQYAALDEAQTGMENLRMMGRLRGLSGREARLRADALLAQFDLSEERDRRVGAYSGGMRRRLDLAASIVVQPRVLFLDEPTTGLDPRSRRELWQVVRNLAGAGVTILLTSQYLEEADQLASRIAVLDHGRIMAEGTPAELKHSVADQRLDLTLRPGVDLPALAARLGDGVLRQDPAERMLSVATTGAAANVRDLLDEIDPDRATVERFSVRSASLDDVYLTLTGRSATEQEPTNV